MEENDQPVEGVEVEAGSTEPTATEYEKEPIEGESDNPEGESPEDDEEETEYEGKKYKLPKELREALLRHKDYTQKTQETAEEKRAVAAERERIQQDQRSFQEQVQRQQQNIQAYARVEALDQQLQQYQNVNWQALSATDPVAAQQHFFQMQQLKDQRNGLVSQISQHEHNLNLQAQQNTAKQLQTANEELSREIKDWSPAKQRELREYGKKIGLTDQQLNDVRSPVAIKMLEKARLWDQHVANATKKPAAAPVVPIKTVKAGSGSATNPMSLSADEWAKHRNEELAKKRRR